jgi:hypothetical protein
VSSQCNLQPCRRGNRKKVQNAQSAARCVNISLLCHTLPGPHVYTHHHHHNNRTTTTINTAATTAAPTTIVRSIARARFSPRVASVIVH